jgi:alpha-beta hydrolase superfamily lysophospholipase
MPELTIILLAVAIVSFCGVAAAIAFGGPAQPPSMQSVSDPFKSVDFSDLPPRKRFSARDGAQLAYRAYGQAGSTGADKGTVVLVHGSSSRSDSIHALAKGFFEAGFIAYALDMRGHGESGEKGKIAYIGQLEDDIEDFLKASRPLGKKSLIGFSAGGGFALRFAADARRNLFDNYLLLSPFLSQASSTYRPASGGWVSVGMPRILGLVILNRIGISTFNDLPVTAYALSPEAQKILTPRYSFSLAMNFRPHNNYRADIASLSQPMEVLVGQSDDQFFPERFAPEFSIAGRNVPVSIVPNTGHMDLTLTPVAIQAAVTAIGLLNAGANRANEHLCCGGGNPAGSLRV